MATDTTARVHRFQDKVAVYVGNGSTTYLTADQASELALALANAVHDIDSIAFTLSTFAPVEIK